MFNVIKINAMATPKGYELKRGVLLQAFGHPDKACTDKTLTDELAEWHLSYHPECIIYFSRVPVQIVPVPPVGITVVPPIPKETQEDPAVNKEISGKSPRKTRTPSQSKK